ncbi:hypothetical protein AcV5_004394 [Taiwanofungus camphoratus]|nr:hypothetical protein AcV5_004394 [Antrodia cinnamomea]
MVETLGSVNVLCSDKTGTLTQNEMRVHNIAVFDKVFETSTFGEAITISPPSSAANLAQSTAVGVICNAATSGADEIISGRKREKIITGDATDVAILEFCGTVLSVNDIRNSWTEVFRLDFHSKNKFMLKLSKLSTTAPSEVPPLASWDQFATDDYLLSIKGAPEVLISRCKFVLDPNGGPPIPLSSSALERIVAIQEKWAQHGQRVLLARRVIRANLIPKTFDPLSDDFARLIDRHNCELIIVALVGLIDPLKPSIKRTVSICRRAGIRFFVVTGDHPSTSVAIAAQAGIISNTNSVQRISDLDPTINPEAVPRYDPDSEEPKLKSIVITGPELDQLNDSQIEQLCQYQEVVFARTTPEQKLHIVCDLQKRRNIVAMTGDGVNDAPSLKAADCGIAMGKGSDVAREAADMVLLDDFSAIVVALKYGRLVHDNLKKTILYLLPAGSFSELMPMLLNMLIGVPQMLSNIQMILICVATDVLPALSLCLEDPEMGLLERKPRDVTRERLVDWRLLLHAYGFLGMAESLCAMSMSFWYLQRHGVPFSNLALGFGEWPGLDHELLLRAQSVYFFTLVLMQWGNLFATRSRKLSIFQHTPVSNWSVFPACGMALCIGIFFSYVPWFQGVFQTRPIAPEFFFIPITFGLSVIFLDESRKYFVRRYPSGFVAFLAW